MVCDFYVVRVLRIQKEGSTIDVPFKFKQFYYLPIDSKHKHYESIKKNKMKEMEISELIFADNNWLTDEHATYKALLHNENNGCSQIHLIQYAVAIDGWPP